METKTKKITKAKQINNLINEYNSLEDRAFSKLVEIFYLLKAGESMRRIEFEGAGVLTNCWDKPDNLDKKLYLNQYNRKIKRFTVSNPRSIEK